MINWTTKSFVGSPIYFFCNVIDLIMLRKRTADNLFMDGRYWNRTSDPKRVMLVL